MNAPLIIAGIAAAGAAIGAAAYAFARPSTEFRTTRGESVEGWISQRRLRTPTRDDLRRVPIIDPVRVTPFWRASSVPDGNGPDTYRAILDTFRGYARAAGEDIDVRILWGLWSNECGSKGEGCREFNAGNTHADALIWATPADARAGRVYTTHPTMRGIFLARDGGIVPFSAWSDFGAFVRYQCGLFRALYPGAYDALRTGGIESLEAFARGLVMGRAGPYMALGSLTTEQRIAHELASYRSQWTRRAQRAGVAWER